MTHTTVSQLPLPRNDGEATPIKADPDAVPRRFTTEQLFAGEYEVEILHGETRYRLRRTSQGKLILTK